MKSPHVSTAIIAGLAILLSAGCETPASPEAAPINHIYDIGAIQYGLSEIPREANEEAVVARLETEREILDAFLNSTAGISRSDWRAAQAAMNEAVAPAQGRTQEKMEQMVAAAMLRVWLSDDILDAEQQRAAARHTQTLVRHRSPEANLIVDGLARSGLVLSDSEKADLASRTLAYLEDRAARLGDSCSGCTIPSVAASLDRFGDPAVLLRSAVQKASITE
ncbi:MAG: hypothetical protein AAGI52_11750 [Bacteroidota bacterium]